MEAKQCGCCGSGSRIKMPGDIVSWEAIQYSAVYCSCSDHSLSKTPQDRSAGRAITKCWLRLCLHWSVSYIRLLWQRGGFPIRDVIEGMSEPVCIIGLKSNKIFTRGSQRTQGKNADIKKANTKLSVDVWIWKKKFMCVGFVCLPLLEFFSTARPHTGTLHPDIWLD